MRIRPLATIIRHELLSSLSSARVLLFLVLFGSFWAFWLWLLSDMDMSLLATNEGVAIFNKLIRSNHSQHLFVDHPIFLSVIFLIALVSLPFFTMIVACNQTATDISSRYIRFLLPRVNRIELFLGRFIGTAILVGLAYILLTVVATIIAWKINSTDQAILISYAARIGISLVLYSLAITAFMAMISSITGSVGISLLLGIGGYVGFHSVLLIMLLKPITAPKYLTYLLPTYFPNLGGIVPKLTSPEPTAVQLAIISLVAYTVVYCFLGWLRFRNRDV